MPLATDNDLLSLFSGGQFFDEPIEDEVLACFTDGCFGSELAVAIVVPPRPQPARVAVGGGGGYGLAGHPLSYYYSQPECQPELVPVSAPALSWAERSWSDGSWMSRRRRPPRPPPPYSSLSSLMPPPPPPPEFYDDPVERRELPWKAIAFGAVGILIGIWLARTVFKDSK